ncbi:UNVERIFIED_CONTAM: hypothetical protein Slati_1930700 [Sesamum latifolium]|uniref:RNase H type-1 domain-containing protein n=1 Tax=Sesamum latifolium TaxID=2727402 RepID=A0AAW2X2V7_9LAMI
MPSTCWNRDREVAAKYRFHLQKHRPRVPLLTQWNKPIDGWWKLNYDGASKGNPRASGAGGLIRDCHSNLVLAFADFLGEQTNAYAELYTVVRGLHSARDARCSRLSIEIDAMVVLHIIQKGDGDWRL